MKQKFTQPIARPHIIRLFSVLNLMFILRGLPLLRHVWGFRPWSRIVKIHFSDTDKETLRRLTGEGKSVHFVPVHPMFFIDWMIDKYVTDHVAPLCAHWASGGVVNGMGSFVKRMCLSNNIIAQGTDEPEKARAFSVAQAAQGTGVLLHPEGRVSWFANQVGPLLPGAAQMAQETYAHPQVKEAYLAPIVWKVVFRKDVSRALLREYRYVLKRLGYNHHITGITPAEAVYNLYNLLVMECERDWFLQPQVGKLIKRRSNLAQVALDYLASEININVQGPGWSVQNRTSKWLNANPSHAKREKVKAAQKALTIALELQPHVFENASITQEEVAEHLKRLRSSFCKGTLRDAVNKNAPRLAGAADLYVSVPEPVLVEQDANTDGVSKDLREHMQQSLDTLVGAAHSQHTLVRWQNPFYYC